MAQARVETRSGDDGDWEMVEDVHYRDHDEESLGTAACGAIERHTARMGVQLGDEFRVVDVPGAVT